jgi:hypothetical protein
MTWNLRHTLHCCGWFYCALTFITGFSECLAQGTLIEKSGEWDRIIHGEYLVENCTWNTSDAKSKWQETIFCDTVKGSYGWRWDFSREQDKADTYVVKTFPEIIFGRKPYDGYSSTTMRLPMVLASAQFRLQYEYTAHADGIYNTSTDISFTSSKDPGPANIRAKMMIWFDHHNMPFFDSKITTRAMIGGRQHEVFIDTAHRGPEGAWVFIALLPENFPRSGELNLRDYFDFALSVGALKPEWFLSSIEIGSEIASGKGEITFKRFEVH